MIYFFSKLKLEMDFENREFWEAKRPSRDAIRVDRVAVEPGVTASHVKHLTVDYKACAVLYLSGWDAVMFMTVLMAEGILTPRPSSRFWALFHGNPMEGLKTVCRTAFDRLPAPGECGYFKKLQYSSNPASWDMLRDGVSRQTLSA